jgi:hypothetical protein
MADSESSTIVFPFPIDVIRPFLEGVARTSAASRDEPEVATRDVRDQLAAPATSGGKVSAEVDAPNSRSSPANPAHATR